MNVVVSQTQLRQALESFFRQESAGLMDTRIGEIYAIDEAGNQWPITGLSVDAQKASDPVRPVAVEVRTKTGNTIRLATHEGEAV